MRAADFADFTRRYDTLTSGHFPLPRFDAATLAGFQARFLATQLHDVAIVRGDGVSALRTASGPAIRDDVVRLWLVDRGEWALGDSRDGSAFTVTAGGFALRHVGRLTHFATPPGTSAQIFVLPAAELTPLLHGRTVRGAASTAEVRLLAAHAGMIQKMASALSSAGVDAARETLIELARAVALRGFDAADSRLAPALTEAAKAVAERRLTDPDLSPAMLARELNVSVRTLQRAFAADGLQVATWIRERRLQAARSALEQNRWSVSEIAARWHFADGSHFSRAFKKRYGLAPVDHARECGR